MPFVEGRAAYAYEPGATESTEVLRIRTDELRKAFNLSGRVKTGHLWTPQNRPFPAPETGVDRYFTASCVRKLVWSLMRQLRGPHLSTYA